MKTPEEIKKGLTCAIDGCLEPEVCERCPYNIEADVMCHVSAIANDTLALIERLESERDAALSKVPKWISVEDRLPDHNQRVLAYRAESRDTFEEFRMCCGWAIKGKITHWMPLPEPPEEERE